MELRWRCSVLQRSSVSNSRITLTSLHGVQSAKVRRTQSVTGLHDTMPEEHSNWLTHAHLLRCHLASAQIPSSSRPDRPSNRCPRMMHVPQKSGANLMESGLMLDGIEIGRAHV